MGTYVMFTRLSHDALQAANSPEDLCRAVMERVHRECPGVAWKLSYAVLGGPADYLDIFTAPDIEPRRRWLPSSALSLTPRPRSGRQRSGPRS
ncbi:MAG TPA: GYD domain-containing protein, partial [Hyphomicrobiaceae bacterium]|nr:GYD domain-containing protein [Hyphomicrobiaceae bacterium]